MRIGVNLLALRPAVMGGAEIYVRDLLAELLRLGGHEYVLVVRTDASTVFPASCRQVLMGGPERLRWLGARLGPLHRALRSWRRRLAGGPAKPMAEVIRREGIELWFCPFTDLQPRVCPVASVITVHDLQHEYHPEFFAADELQHRRTFYPESCGAADHIIAVSEFTRQCVLERYGVEPGRISTVWEAAGADVDWSGAAAQVDTVRRAYALPLAYAFYPANLWPHKNHRRLLEALAIYRMRHGGSLGLVLAGAHVNGARDLETVIADLRLHDAVRVLGYVQREDLPALYAGATCLVLPSLFEGFGIPLVEAMQVGCPIIAARATSIPEVVGDAAILFDPRDPTDIARALAEVASDPARAAELAQRGHRRSVLFSASAAARRTLAIFEDVAGRAGDQRGKRPVAVGVDGIYPDRWMGRYASISLRGPVTSLEIEGNVPPCVPLSGLTMMVRVAGARPLRVLLGKPGVFSVTVPLDGSASSGVMCEVSLSTRRTFRPRRHGISPDDRDLSVQLSRLRVRTRDGREVVKVLGSP